MRSVSAEKRRVALLREFEGCGLSMAEFCRRRAAAVAQKVKIFLAIHPFQEGNGRLLRIVTTLLLLRAGFSYAKGTYYTKG